MTSLDTDTATDKSPAGGAFGDSDDLGKFTQDQRSFDKRQNSTAEDANATPWNKLDDSLFATVASRRRGTRYHLLAERLPGDGWDWTVWRAGDCPDCAQHGYAPSPKTAMAAAGGAVRHWDDDAQSRSANAFLIR